MQGAKWIAVPGVAVAIALAVAACGGSSSNSNGTTPTTTTTTTTTTTSPSTTESGGAERLSAAEWQTYQTKNKAFLTATNEGIAKFRSCGTAAGRTTNAQQYVKCMGDTASKVIAATTDLGTTLHGFHPSAAGSCSAAINAYVGALYQWRSVVQSVQQSLSSAAPQSSGAAANARTQYPAVQSAAKTFNKDCRPAGT